MKLDAYNAEPAWESGHCVHENAVSTVAEYKRKESGIMTKILIVDDSAFARRSLSMIVESAGHKVVGLAENAEQALEFFKSRNPELVLLDYLMPGKNGEEVLKEIIGHDPAARVIMISGSGDETVANNALEHGAKVFLRKPYDIDVIVKTINEVMQV